MISTHPLTVLTISAITCAEQRNREDPYKTKTLLPLLTKLINHSFLRGGMTYVVTEYFWRKLTG